MQSAATFADIGHVIQLSVAPVFLLVAVGSMLNVMTSRLGRVVDRARKLEEDISRDKTADLRQLRIDELKALDRRMSYANYAINLCAIAALLIAFVVVLLFLAGLLQVDTSIGVALLFIVAMIAVIGGLIAFVAEISISMRTIRVRAELLKWK